MSRAHSAERRAIPGWLEVIRLRRGEWRISDLRVDTTDSARLLGYVEKLVGNRFELVWMTDPMRWGYVETFVQAIAGFEDAARFSGHALAERDQSVSSRAWSPLRRIRRRTISSGSPDEHVA